MVAFQCFSSLKAGLTLVIKLELESESEEQELFTNTAIKLLLSSVSIIIMETSWSFYP